MYKELIKIRFDYVLKNVLLSSTFIHFYNVIANFGSVNDNYILYIKYKLFRHRPYSL